MNHESANCAEISALHISSSISIILDHDVDEINSDFFGHHGCFGHLFFIVGVLIADTALTIMWSYSKIIHTMHLIAYILLGWLFYMVLPLDLMNITGVGAIGVIFFIMPILLFFGLIPFIVCRIGRKTLTKYMKKRELLQRSGKYDDVTKK